MLLETVTERDALDDLTSALDLCDGMADCYDTHLLWLANEPRKGVRRRRGYHFWKDDPGLSDELALLFEGLLPDIVHTHRLRELATVGHAARKAGVPHLVHTICGEFGKAPKWRLQQFAAAAQGLSPVLIAPSEEAAQELPTDARIEILPVGVDCERYVPGDGALARRKVGLPSAPRIIGCSTPTQALETLFHAMFRMDADIHLALFGKARPDNADRAMLRRLGLEERVHVLGSWAKPELVYQAIDIYFHGPAGDCMPRAVLAAQACGKLVVACTPTPSSTLCPDTGRLAPMDYMPTLSHALRLSLNSAAPGVTRQFVLDRWNVRDSVDSYARLFRQFAKRGNRAFSWPCVKTLT